jgi:hypothetical protein
MSNVLFSVKVQLAAVFTGGLVGEQAVSDGALGPDEVQVTVGLGVTLKVLGWEAEVSLTAMLVVRLPAFAELNVIDSVAAGAQLLCVQVTVIGDPGVPEQAMPPLGLLQAVT